MTKPADASGGKLSSEQIAQYAANAGFTGQDLKIAVAVALAESGGNPRAHNPVGKDDSYGLWQINMRGGLGPERRKLFDISNNEQLYDPAVNAKAAYLIWKRNGWDAWTTYTHKKYEAFLSGLSASGGIAGSIGSALSTADTASATVSNPIDKVASAIDGFSKNVFNGVAGIAALGIASVLLILGIIILMRNTKVVKTVKSVAVTAATRGIKRGLK